jgi:hypothetical protein
MCGGSGRLKGTLPKVKCPVCGGSKELNLYVSLTHPIILELEPAAIASINAPRIELHSLDKLRPASTAVISIHGDNRALAQSYVRHMNLVCMAFEGAVSDAALFLAAKDSNHPWAVALRAAITSTVCQACHGHGRLFVVAPDVIQGMDLLHRPAPPPVRHDLGICGICNGTGSAIVGARSGLLSGVHDELLRLHRECPDDGPSDQSPSGDWCKDNRWVRCTDLTRSNGNNVYNGLDFLSLEILLRLAGAGGHLLQAASDRARNDAAEFFAPNLGIYYVPIPYPDGTIGLSVSRAPDPNSPGGKGGLEKGDVILTLDSMPVRNHQDVLIHTGRTPILVIDVKTGQRQEGVLQLP